MEEGINQGEPFIPFGMQIKGESISHCLRIQQTKLAAKYFQFSKLNVGLFIHLP